MSVNLQNTPLSTAAREVIDTSQWFSIATTGPDGPHLAACWTRNILKLGYPRYFNSPNQRAVCAKIAALELGEDALAFGSGMAAISTTLLALLNPGDHAVFQADLYGETLQLVSKQLERLGMVVSFVDGSGDFDAAIRPETRLIYVESPSNPLLRCVNLSKIAALGLGGVETLVCIPAITSHRELDATARESLGISDGLIRVSVGVEDIDDLIDDFSQALDGGTLRVADDWSV